MNSLYLRYLELKALGGNILFEGSDFFKNRMNMRALMGWRSEKEN